MELNNSNYNDERIEQHFYYCNPYFYFIPAFVLFFIFWGFFALTYHYIAEILGAEIDISVNGIVYIVFAVIAIWLAHSIILRLIDRKGMIVLNKETFTLITKKAMKEIAYSDLVSIKTHVSKNTGPDPTNKYWSPITVDYIILTKQKKYSFSSSLLEGYQRSTFNSRYDLIKPHYSLDDAMFSLIQRCPNIEIIRE